MKQGSALELELRVARLVTGSTFKGIIRHIKRTKGKRYTHTTILAVTTADIDKALAPKTPKTYEDLKTQIPAQFHDFLPLFSPKEAAKLPPHRPGVDHEIRMKKDSQGKDLAPP